MNVYTTPPSVLVTTSSATTSSLAMNACVTEATSREMEFALVSYFLSSLVLTGAKEMQFSIMIYIFYAELICVFKC